jgi:hypothetical protein
MAYAEEHLMAGERVIYRTTMTKAVFIWPALFLLASPKSGLMLAISIGLAVYLYLMYTSSEFAVTNNGSSLRSAFLAEDR